MWNFRHDTPPTFSCTKVLTDLGSESLRSNLTGPVTAFTRPRKPAGPPDGKELINNKTPYDLVKYNKQMMPRDSTLISFLFSHN